METIDRNTQEALAWLRYTLNPVGEIPIVSDWEALLAFARKQRIAGVCSPTAFPVALDRAKIRQWMSIIDGIRKQYARELNRMDELCRVLEGAGFTFCILKGQGNARMYPSPFQRSPGDIDVWIDSDEETVYAFAKKMFPDEEETFKHIHFPLFEDVPVDLHVTPLKYFNRRYQKRLQRWIDSQKDEQFRHRISFTGLDREVCVPTCRFNSVYLLGHMLIHLFDEGVGLRHVIDYFYLLKKLDATDVQKEQIRKDFSDLGMMRFAKAVMWIERSVLGLPEEYCLVESDERGGRKLLADMLEGGNFGQFSTRYQGRRGFYRLGMIKAKRTIDLFSIFPSEAVSRAGHRIHAALIHTFGKRPEQHK